ncbi:hypothetical protein [Pseudoalteromonas sp. Ld20]|uniref:hypothetical protein n=1 Tax=Pseudoalteromonas sp. Ld20 TaxID=649165 RepID=UPI0038697CA4
MKRSVIGLLSVIFILSACNNSNEKNNKVNEPPTSVTDPVKDPITSLLITSTTGGSKGIGSWTTFDSSSVSVKDVVTAEGGPIPSSVPLDMGVIDAQAGFAFNSVTGLFYGIIPNRLRGDVVVFDPKKDSLEHVATIPPIYIADASKPLSQYFTAPAISPDGRSLMMIAQSGGPNLPQPPVDSSQVTSGALVHLNIDVSSDGYGQFTPVYGMYEFGQNKDYKQRINKVSMVPLLASTPIGDVIFLVSNFTASAYSVKNNTQLNYDVPAKAFAIAPSNTLDWSKPWGLVDINSNNIDDDDVNAVLGQPAPQASYDITRNEFVFATEQAPDNTWIYQKDGPAVAVNSVDIGVLNSSRGAKNPVAIIRQYGSDYYLLTAGDGPNIAPELDAAAFFEITNTDQLLDRARLSAYWTGKSERRVPVGLSSSRTTGYHFVNATSTIGANQFDNYIVSKFWGDIDNLPVTSNSEFLDTSLESLLQDAGVMPSLIDRYDYNGLARKNLFNGSVNDGYLINGVPAIGGLPAEPRADRYVVSLATLGGKHGHGAIIKYDRVTAEVVSVPLGNATAGFPLGKPLQLESGVVLGGTLNRVNSGVNPQRSNVGVWTLDITTKKIQDFALPDTDSERNDGRWYTRAVNPPKGFAKTKNGQIWGTVVYEIFDPISPFIAGAEYYPYVAGLLSFDAKTGQPSGELYLFGESESILDADFTGAVAHDDKLSFITPALRVEDNGAKGQRLWFVDVNNRDANGRPDSNFILFSPEASSVAAGAWKIPFAAAADNESGDFYVMTTAIENDTEVRIHKAVLGELISSEISISTVVSGPKDGLTDLPGTPLFQASDGLFYYLTNNAKLMLFNPNNSTVTVLADFTLNETITSANGFITEPEQGVIMGIVSDSSFTQPSISRRAFSFNLDEKTWFTVDVTKNTSVEDQYLGITAVVK